MFSDVLYSIILYNISAAIFDIAKKPIVYYMTRSLLCIYEFIL